MVSSYYEDRMKNYFYNINKKYIDAFSSNVLSRFREEPIRSNVSFMKGLFHEINDLFSRIGGKIASKSDIPKPTEYPDSRKFNRLIKNIAFDIDKIYTAQKLIEDDLNNLVNFNSTQRIRTFENLVATQQRVYSTYVKNKVGIRGEIRIPAQDPFSSADNISDESEGINIDEAKGILTLDHSTKITKPVRLDSVRMFFSGAKPNGKIYPNRDQMGLGSHWKISGGLTAHHIDDSNDTEAINYKNMLIDDPNSNYGIGYCEFEGVKTTIAPQDVIPTIKKSYRLSDSDEGSLYFKVSSTLGGTKEEDSLRRFIGSAHNKDEELIYLDIPNSLQGKYVNYDSVSNAIFTGQKPQYKLVIPFLSDAPFTNQINITVQPNSLGNYPKLNWDQSKVFTNIDGSDIPFNILKPLRQHIIPENGEYVCNIRGGYIKPSRMELIFEYGGDDTQWAQIGFSMAHWQYTVSDNYFLPVGSDQEVALILGKTYDVYVDAEPNEDKEKQRALNVLLARGK